MSQYTASSSIYTLSSAGRSNTSIDSFTSCSSSSPIAQSYPLHSEQTSESAARVVVRSSLAQRIANARKQKAASVEDIHKVEAVTTPIDEMTRRAKITAKFLENEKQWQIDACMEKDKRVAQALQTLGF